MPAAIAGLAGAARPRLKSRWQPQMTADPSQVTVMFSGLVGSGPAGHFGLSGIRLRDRSPLGGFGSRRRQPFASPAALIASVRWYSDSFRLRQNFAPFVMAHVPPSSFLSSPADVVGAAVQAESAG